MLHSIQSGAAYPPRLCATLKNTESRKAYFSGHRSWRKRPQESAPFSIPSSRVPTPPLKLQKRACVVQVSRGRQTLPEKFHPPHTNLTPGFPTATPGTHRYVVDTLSFGSDQEDFPEVHVWPKRKARLGRGLGTRWMRVLPLAEPKRY